MAKTYKIALLPGDGIGPEVMSSVRPLFDHLTARRGFSFKFEEYLIGGSALDAYGVPLRDEDLDAIRQCDAALLAALGGPKWDKGPAHLRPEAGLLKIRGGLGVFANLRPAKIMPSLVDASKLKPEVARNIDLLVIRELVGGIYFGEPRGRVTEKGVQMAFNTMRYSEPEIRRIAKVAFDAARGRKKHVTSVDKANVLVVSQLWREIVEDVHRDYPDVRLDHLYVDNASMQLIRNPGQFDVILTGNLFGDILSDEASELVGSIGLLASASIGASRPGLFEPIHGSAPDIAGKKMANPTAMWLSAAMLFRHGLGEEQAADLIESSVFDAIEGGARTADLGGKLTTGEMTRRFLDILEGRK